MGLAHAPPASYGQADCSAMPDTVKVFRVLFPPWSATRYCRSNFPTARRPKRFRMPGEMFPGKPGEKPGHNSGVNPRHGPGPGLGRNRTENQGRNRSPNRSEQPGPMPALMRSHMPSQMPESNPSDRPGHDPLPSREDSLPPRPRTGKNRDLRAPVLTRGARGRQLPYDGRSGWPDDGRQHGAARAREARDSATMLTGGCPTEL